ncbi:RNF213 [Mytilus coruscus]|uniref:RNF213 n=1 Tax=Mytilus coruscus TaxID=42192 RepID=A0A6J8E6V5_MYTCO|nr:RNF213 [Mytilus coruscus]
MKNDVLVVESHFNLVMKAAETYQEMQLGSVLANIEGSHIHQALKDYIHDFVQMIHFISSDLEHQTLDIFALTWLLQDLTPNQEELNKSGTRMKWFNRVARYRPIIERVIGHFNDDKSSGGQYYGPRCVIGMAAIRYQWTSIHVVKLFIENVCTLQDKEDSSNSCMTLWLLDETADLKTQSSFENVELFLTKWNENVINQYFGGDIDNYNEFRRRCNSFFLDIVSQLCFAERTPPSQEVIEKLFSYVVNLPDIKAYVAAPNLNEWVLNLDVFKLTNWSPLFKTV